MNKEMSKSGNEDSQSITILQQNIKNKYDNLQFYFLNLDKHKQMFSIAS